MATGLDSRFDKFIRALSDVVADRLKALFQDKHLYQSLTLDFSSARPALDECARIGRPVYDKPDTKPEDSLARSLPWLPEDNQRSWYPPGSPTRSFDGIPFRLPTVRLYCRNCSGSQPFNLLSAEDICAQWGGVEADKPTTQVFLFTVLCQQCKEFPEAFLVRRCGLKGQLAGRAPMEEVAVPSVIPARIRRYFSQAVVAFNSGQVLPGLFMLRVLIEQYVQPYRPEASRCDEAIEAYNRRLPNDFKDRFPSLTKLYTGLSAAIHTAAVGEGLFSATQEDLLTHFEARRLFRLDELQSAESETVS